MGPKSKEHTLVKNDGQVFTPEYIVTDMLDFCGYHGSSILNKHVIDNSCGDGAFLRVVLRRYIEEARKANDSDTSIKHQLETYIHGLDTDPIAFSACVSNLSAIAEEYGISNVSWDLRNESSLSAHQYDGKMDYVVGNPPYVRVHNLNEAYDEVKQFSFANGGMTDLYLVFYELGFRMLNKEGVLCYITPSSWLSSVAGSNLRNYIRVHRNLLAVIDIGHFQPFNATAYTLIALFKKNAKNDAFDYYVFDGNTKTNVFKETLSFEEVDIDGNFYLASPKTLKELREIKGKKQPKIASVKNGFATLADKVFIGNVPKSSITIPVIKASTGKWYDCLYPYDRSGQPIPESKLFAEPAVKAYFEQHKDELLKGAPEYPGWFYFGRTQALKDVYTDKYSINSLVLNQDSIKLHKVPAGSGVYSGLYILTNVEEKVLLSILKSADFVSYVATLKNYKSGGYYTFNSKDLEQYLNFKLNQLGHKQINVPDNYGQQSLFECY